MARLDFQFSEITLNEIREVVEIGCAQPSAFEYAELSELARTYFQKMRDYRPPALMGSEFMRVASYSKKLRLLIATLFPDSKFTLQDGESTLIQTLADLERDFECAAGLSRSGYWPHPQFELMEQSLRLWLYAGGALRISRPSDSSADRRGPPGGPTLRYMEIVAKAVLGLGAPEREGLRKILERVRREMVHAVQTTGQSRKRSSRLKMEEIQSRQGLSLLLLVRASHKCH